MDVFGARGENIDLPPEAARMGQHRAKPLVVGRVNGGKVGRYGEHAIQAIFTYPLFLHSASRHYMEDPRSCYSRTLQGTG